MNYIPTNLHDAIHLDKLYTIHYFEYMCDFNFEGEQHNFWEFVYVDKGEVTITAGEKTILLKKNDIIFHQPNEFHSVTANGQSAPNLIVVSFSSSSPAMQFFAKRLMQLDETEHNLLAEAMKEARLCFSCRFDDPYLTYMEKSPSSLFGAEQMIRIYLEHLFIHLIRRQIRLHTLQTNVLSQANTTTHNQNAEDIFKHVIQYLENHLTEKLTLEQICHDNSVGRSHLQKIFHDQSGHSVIEYFSNLKIDTAKELLRTNQLNITQISERLGYTSVHYFSRQFKKLTGMSPSEYASSIKAISEGSFK